MKYLVTTLDWTDCDEQKQWLSLPKPFFETKPTGREDYTGVWVTKLFYGKKSKRCFVETYSIWDDGRGKCIGYTVNEVRKGELAEYVKKVGVEMPDEIDAEEID